MADVTGDVIRVLSELGLVQASSDGGITPGVQLSVDANNNTVLVGADRTVLLAFDATGNIIAQVTPRSDTLANLLLVADAGEGEIASATDVDAIVKYSGTPSVGKAHYMSKEVGGFLVAGDAVNNNPLTATDTAFLLVNVSVDTLGVVDTTNDIITIPSSGVTHLELALNIAWPAGAGTYRRVFIEYDVTGFGTWILLASLLDCHTANVASTLTRQYAHAGLIAITPYLGKKLRVRIKHDAGVTLNNVGGSVSGKFYNYA